MLNSKPYKQGYCDGILGRDSNNPYTEWKDIIKASKYLSGYLDGKLRRKQDNIGELNGYIT